MNKRNVDYKYPISRRLLSSHLDSFSLRKIWTKLKHQDQEIKSKLGKARRRSLNLSLKYLTRSLIASIHLILCLSVHGHVAPNPCAKRIISVKSLKEIYEMFSSNNHFSLQRTARGWGVLLHSCETYFWASERPANSRQNHPCETPRSGFHARPSHAWSVRESALKWEVIVSEPAVYLPPSGGRDYKFHSLLRSLHQNPNFGTQNN